MSLWFCYQPDFSGFEIYSNELDAYRAAVKGHMEVQQIHEGDVKEQLGKPYVPAADELPEQQNLNQEEITNGNNGNPAPRKHRPEPTPAQEGFTAEQLQAQARLKAQENSEPDVVDFTRRG